MSSVLTLRNGSRKKSGIGANDYTNAQILADFNQAYFTLAPIIALIEPSYFQEGRTKFSLVANSGLYSLPTDFIAMKQLRLAYSTPSGPGDYRISTKYDVSDVHNVSIDEINVPITNPIHDLTNTYVRIQPKPTTAVTDGGMFFYIAMPSALVNTGDVPVLPLQYHEMLEIYSAKEQCFKYEKWNKFERLEKSWNGKIAELTQTLADRDLDQLTRFKAPQEIGPLPRRYPSEFNSRSN